MVDVSIGDYIAPAKVNPYTPAVKALAEANQKSIAAGGLEQSITLTVTAPDVNKTARAFGEAANGEGFTAKRRLAYFTDADKGEDGKPVPITSEEISAAPDDDRVSLVFTLGQRQSRPGAGVKKDTADASAKGKK